MASKKITRYGLFIYQVENRIDSGIYRPLYFRTALEIAKVVDTPPENTHIDVFIESGGGDADAAYKIMLELRAAAKSLSAFVGDNCKSAATLMVLGMDDIYMSPAAELGPLDVQIPHPDRENVRISGLDVVNSLSFIATAANGMVLTNGANLIKYTGLTRSEVISTQFHFMGELLQPVMAKIDPSILHQAANQLKVAEAYAERLLGQRNVPPEFQLDQDGTKKLIRSLVHDYPAHGFVICRDEARDKLKLPVKNAEDHPRADLAFEVMLEAYRKGTDIVRAIKYDDIAPTEGNDGEKKDDEAENQPPKAGGANGRKREKVQQ